MKPKQQTIRARELQEQAENQHVALSTFTRRILSRTRKNRNQNSPANACLTTVVGGRAALLAARKISLTTA